MIISDAIGKNSQPANTKPYTMTLTESYRYNPNTQIELFWDAKTGMLNYDQSIPKHITDESNSCEYST